MYIFGYAIIKEEDYNTLRERYFDYRDMRTQCYEQQKLIDKIRIEKETKEDEFFNNLLKMIDEGKEVYFYQNYLNDYNSYFAFHDTLKPATKITMDQYGQLRVLSKVKSNLIEKEK